MKSPWKAFCIVVLLDCAIPAVVRAQFLYTINPDLTITITGYTGPGGAVIVPGTINSLPVTSIGVSAFLAVHGLTSITVPNSVTSLGDHAFGDCTSLTNVSLGNAITNIPPYAFAGCTDLRSVTMPSTVNNIGDYSFDGCTSLTNVAIPSNVTTIGTNAFSACTSLTNVTIPSSVTTIGVNAFQNCTDLLAIDVNVSNLHYSSVDGVLFDKSLSTLVTYPPGKVGTPYTVPGSVSSIAFGGFFGCLKLAGVTIPAAVTTIGDYAFAGCASLTNVTFPSSVTNIGAYVFEACTNLTKFTIGNSVTTIGIGAFQSSGLTSVTIPDSVTYIGGGAFYLCYSITNATIGKNVALIGDNAFNSPNLAGVYFLGNAPVVSSATTFVNTSILYYMSGTMGWSSPFAGCLALPIAMKIQTMDASFGVHTNQFGFNITGSYGLTIVVEAATTLAKPTWYPLATNTLTASPFYFSDPQWANYPNRFYRLRWP